MRASLIILSCSLAAGTAMPVHAQNAESVRLGEAALTFAAGSIRQEMPLDGVVNVITGDNQLSGNRMMIGWTGTDTLYLKLKNPGDVALGDLYTVYRRSRKVFHPITKQYLGYIINRLGVVKVIQLDPLLVGVRVVRSYASFSPGDPVMRFTPPSTEDVVDAASSAGDVEAMVVDLQSDKNMSLVAQGNLVYLDKGQDDGLRAGDYLEVFRTGGGLPERKIGEVKVLSTEPRTATALLSKATARALIGDRVRSKHSSPVEAMQSEGGDFDSPAATVQPVMAGGVGTASSPSTEPPSLSKARIERTRGITTINLDDLADQLEYESGEVKVKPAGVPILQQLTEYLNATAVHQQVRVEGHSDNMEIGPTLKGQFPTNWELSKARAADIVRYLIEKGGMDSAKLSAVGYGASRPVASNATEEGRKKNRRIEVVIESLEDGPTTRPVKGPAREEQPKPAQVSLNEVGVAPSDAVVGVSAPATPIGSIPSDAASDHATPSEMATPAAPAGGESTSITPGL
ncbi:MAG: OmpA family protein [Nitrospira defluvii]|nr:OmpA family protein [Nitrospira defluvii]